MFKNNIQYRMLNVALLEQYPLLNDQCLMLTSMLMGAISYLYSVKLLVIYSVIRYLLARLKTFMFKINCRQFNSVQLGF